jgi:hemin uptake protein HemP
VTAPADDAAGMTGAPAGAPSTARIASSELFHGRRAIVIVHRGEEYRLHITKAGKLLLTK